MTPIAWLVFAAIVIALALTPLTYILSDLRRRAEDLRWQDVAESDADFAGDCEWCIVTHHALDEAIALTVPLYGNETAARIAAIIASNEAERADWDEPSWWVR